MTTNHSKMLAAWYENLGAASDVLRVGELAVPHPGPGELRLRVHASGVNPSDTKRRVGFGGRGLEFSRIVPHSDGAGVVDEVGAGVSETRLGTRVWVHSAQFQRPWGTAAQYTVVPSDNAVELPDTTSFEAGACLGIPAMTAHFCVLSDGPPVGKVVLITGGAGSVGRYAIQWAKDAGATVITTVSGSEKMRVAKTAGADHVVNYRDCDVAEAIEAIAGEQAVARVVEVAFGANLNTSLRVLARNGVLATYASDAEPEPRIPFYSFLVKNVTIRFAYVYLHSEADLKAARTDITRMLRGEMLTHQIGGRFALEDIAAAHEALERGALTGNIILDIPPA